jgi:hypothetical protein
VRVVSLANAPTSWVDRPFSVRPARVLQIALLLLVIGNLGRIPLLDLGEREAPILINDLLVAVVVAVGGIAAAHKRSLRLNDVAMAGVLFAAIGALSAVSAVPRFGLSALELVGSLAYLARWSVYFALYVVVINSVRSEETDRVWSALETALLVMAAFGIVQSFLLPDFAFIVHPESRRGLDWDPQQHRLVSTILDPNLLAGMIGTVLLMQLARLSYGVHVAIWKLLLLFSALVLTLSRSGVLAFFVGCALILFVRGVRKPVLRFAGVVTLLTSVSLPALITFGSQYAKWGFTDESALARLVIWQRAFATFIDHPWFGVGFNTYGYVQERRGIERLGVSAYSAEGGLLFIAVLTGIVGLVVFLCMLWLVLRRCRSGWGDLRASNAERGLFLGTGAATVALLFHSLFVNSLLTVFVAEIYWVLWGLTFVIASDLRRRTT